MTHPRTHTCHGPCDCSRAATPLCLTHETITAPQPQKIRKAPFHLCSCAKYQDLTGLIQPWVPGVLSKLDLLHLQHIANGLPMHAVCRRRPPKKMPPPRRPGLGREGAQEEPGAQVQALGLPLQVHPRVVREPNRLRRPPTIPGCGRKMQHAGGRGGLNARTRTRMPTPARTDLPARSCSRPRWRSGEHILFARAQVRHPAATHRRGRPRSRRPGGCRSCQSDSRPCA